MKHKGKEYSVRDSGCSRLKDICFVPFSGNGINICRLWELGNCPSDERIQTIKQVRKEMKYDRT